jgi:hypothetical protein
MIKASNCINFIVLFFIAVIFFQCTEQLENKHTPNVEVRYKDGRAQLYRHGQPYFIKGAGGTTHLDKVAAYGGNSIRTWSIEDADRILDEAHSLGLTVTLGLEVGRPAWGNDFNYWKFWEVNKKINELVPIIEKYKDHPALLMWGVGNEVELNGGGKRFLIYHTLNRIAKKIKEIDPNHPTMTAIPVPPLKNRLGSFRHVMPHIDILGFNAFDRINTMYDKIYGKKGWNKAYMLSEWGPTGHWEITDTEWGAPKEPIMEEKVSIMERNWNKMHEDSVYFLGSYAFYWGFKYEITHTWFSMFSEEGLESKQVKYLQYAWSGEKAENNPPIITHVSIDPGDKNDNVYLIAGKEYTSKVFAHDPDSDSLFYRWEMRREEYKFYETGVFQNNMEYYLRDPNVQHLEFFAPKEEGDYRLFVFVYDNKGNFTAQNIPFYVKIR